MSERDGPPLSAASTVRMGVLISKPGSLVISKLPGSLVRSKPPGLLVISTILFSLLSLGRVANANDLVGKDTLLRDSKVQVHGSLRGMFHEGQTGVMVTLDTLLPDPNLFGLGALADLAGEVTILGGMVYLSYPNDGEGSVRTVAITETDAGAALLVTTDVPIWRSVTIEASIQFEELDEAIATLATTAGMSLDERFPFLLVGTFEELEWHVVDGRRLASGGTSHQDHLAASVQQTLEQTPARLIGFYSEGDQGIFTHMGSKTHIHCVLDEPLASGHVDHVTIPAGTSISFPVRQDERQAEPTQAR